VMLFDRVTHFRHVLAESDARVPRIYLEAVL
jgi:hypothetical protein